MQFQKKQMVRIMRNSGDLEEAVVSDIIKCDYLVNWKENGKKKCNLRFWVLYELCLFLNRTIQVVVFKACLEAIIWFYCGLTIILILFASLTII